MNTPQFSSPELQENIGLFAKLCSDYQHHLDGFNRDLRNLEKVFQSSGLGSITVEQISCDDVTGANISWDASAKRIMHCRSLGDNHHNRPLIDYAASVRMEALEGKWLWLLLEAATDEVRELRDEAGGPVWQAPVKIAEPEPTADGMDFLSLLSHGFVFVEKASQGLAEDCPNREALHEIAMRLFALLESVKEQKMLTA